MGQSIERDYDYWGPLFLRFGASLSAGFSSLLRKKAFIWKAHVVEIGSH